MNLLLDTHALIWFLENDPQLGARARTAISDPESRSYVSDATAWEIGIKHSQGKLTLPLPFEILFPTRLLMLGFYVLPIRHAHLHQVIHLPYHHRDPFDRMLIAQALAEGMTLVSCDPQFPAYCVPIVW